MRPVVKGLRGDFKQSVLNGELDAEEAEINRIATYRRLSPEMVKTIKSVLETSHSLYLTTLVINGDVFDQLPEKHQQVLLKEADRLAKKERALSIRQEAEAKAQLAAEGIDFVSLSPSDQERLERICQEIRDKHRDELGDWQQAIRAEAQ